MRDRKASHAFYAGILGLPLPDEEYLHTEAVEGVKAFALWKLEEAPESCFGRKEWPADVPAPQCRLEFDVESQEAVAEAAREREAADQRVLVKLKKEEWGQTVLRVLSPEGMLVRVTYTP